MDRTDPNTWTKDFAKNNKNYCFDFLAETNMLVIKYMKSGNYKGAVAGIDRILNGLIVLQNSGVADCKPHLCLFSWCNGDIILHCVNDAPDYKRKEVALANYEDARDFAKSDSTKASLRSIISDIKSGTSVSSLKSRYASNCPQETIETLENLTQELIKSGSGTAPTAPVEYSSYSSAPSYDPPRKKTFREKVKTVKSCIWGIICLWILLAFAVMAFDGIGDAKKFLNSASPTSKPYVTSTTRSTTQNSYTNEYAPESSDITADTQTAYVRPKVGLNLRSAPNTESTKIMLMDCGTPVTIMRTENGWAYVNCGGTYGWCAAEYLNYGSGEQVAGTTAPSTQNATEPVDGSDSRTAFVLPAKGLNLRKSAGETGAKIKVMRQGTQVTVLKVENGWAYVNCDGTYGWCSAEYLNITG